MIIEFPEAWIQPGFITLGVLGWLIGAILTGKFLVIPAIDGDSEDNIGATFVSLLLWPAILVGTLLFLIACLFCWLMGGFRK